MWARRDLNSQSFRNTVLNRARIPFRHAPNASIVRIWQMNGNRAINVTYNLTMLPYAIAGMLVIGFGVAAYFLMLDEAIRQYYGSLIETGLIACATLSLLLVVALLYARQKKELEFTEIKADFVAVASHELRSPLTAIRWSLAALRSDATLQPNIRETVNDLYRKVCALIDLTSTFLLTTSAEHGIMREADFKLLNMGHVIMEAIAHAQSLSQIKKIKIENSIEPEASISVKGDPARLRLVFDNLLSNAIKYSPENSTVSLSYIDKGSNKSFSIQDRGIGIPKADIKKIFDGFHRASNARNANTMGSGFGLYMAKKIVDFHGGTLVCESDLGHGTMFTVTLPTGV